MDVGKEAPVGGDDLDRVDADRVAERPGVCPLPPVVERRDEGVDLAEGDRIPRVQGLREVGPALAGQDPAAPDPAQARGGEEEDAITAGLRLGLGVGRLRQSAASPGTARGSAGSTRTGQTFTSAVSVRAS